MPWEETLTGDNSQDGNTAGHGATGGGEQLTVADSQYTFSIPDLLRRQAHRDQYHAYLKDVRSKLKKIRKIEKNVVDCVTILDCNFS